MQVVEVKTAFAVKKQSEGGTIYFLRLQVPCHYSFRVIKTGMVFTLRVLQDK
jgi:hypothetical protein